MTQRIVDEREAVNVDETHRNALEAAGSHLAQRTIQLIHEVAAVRQPGGRIVVAGMLEVLAQRFILLGFSDQARLSTAQASARRRQRSLGAAQAMRHVVRAPGQQPRQYGDQTDSGGQESCRIPPGAWAYRQLEVSGGRLRRERPGSRNRAAHSVGEMAAAGVEHPLLSADWHALPQI